MKWFNQFDGRILFVIIVFTVITCVYLSRVFYRNSADENMAEELWYTFVKALVLTPCVLFVGYIIILIFETFIDFVAEVISTGYWWVIPILAFLLSASYYCYEPKFKRDRKREKIVTGLVWYWKELLNKHNKSHPMDHEVEIMHEALLKRVKVFAWMNPELWAMQFPDEKYSNYIFEIVDNLEATHMQPYSRIDFNLDP